VQQGAYAHEYDDNDEPQINPLAPDAVMTNEEDSVKKGKPMVIDMHVFLLPCSAIYLTIAL